MVFCCFFVGFLFYFFNIYYFSFTIYWKARNKLLHYDLSVAFSIGTLMVGCLSFCWEGIDFLSLLLGNLAFLLSLVSLTKCAHYLVSSVCLGCSPCND